MRRKHLENGIMGMDRVREILRLNSAGLSQREIHRATGVQRSCVQRYLGAARVNGIRYEESLKLKDGELRQALKRKLPGRERKAGDPDFAKVHAELPSRKGMTLELLWQEWIEAEGTGYSYQTFCRRYREWAKTQSVVLRNEYRGGELLLCDYAGETLSYWDSEDKQCRIEIFVAVLGASNLIYTEATLSQQLLHWVNSNVRALEFIGGTPEAIVIDNLKSGVVRSCRYEPELTRTYEEFAAHFGTAIFPARPNKPKDKAKVEKAVQDVERRLLAPLRHRRFHCIEEINAALRPLLEQLNSRQMRQYGASRLELFERLDKPALKPLPLQVFIPATWKYAKVSLDYHLQIENHYYSVPYYFARKSVWVKISEKLVEILHEGERIASHRRSSEPYRHSTIPAHMPPQHLAVKSRSPEKFLSWAKGIGPQTTELVQVLLASPQYRELSYRSILGLQRLETKFNASALEQAAAIANERRMYSQRFVKTVLENNAFGVDTKEAPVTHTNIRGANYFH